MSMLAERKQKQRWSLNPRGKHWSEDSNKFGQKLLEKMGWKHGKGLGANEDGNTEHVKVSYKNDSKGMGFKDNTEQWTEHDDNFNGLLKALNGDSHDADHSPRLNSLHEIAETTKTRINYHKFTKGKDLSRYSAKDLANIFGKKSLTAKPKPKEIVEEVKPSVIVESDNLVVRGSMADYFKKKIPNFGRNSFGLKIGSNGVLTRDSGSESESERPAFGFGFKSEQETAKPKGVKRKYEETLKENAPEEEIAEDVAEEISGKGKIKSKKVKQNEEIQDIEEPATKETENPGKRKKKKSKKLKSDIIAGKDEEKGETEQPEMAQEQPPEEKKRRKKSKKPKEEIVEAKTFNAEVGEETVEEPTETKTQKKKKKNRNL